MGWRPRLLKRSDYELTLRRRGTDCGSHLGRSDGGEEPAEATRTRIAVAGADDNL